MQEGFWDKFRLAIKEAREHPKKISSRQAALEIGTSASTLSRVEKGFTPDADTFFKICTWINKSNKKELDISDFNNDKTPNFIEDIFTVDEEKEIFNLIELVSAAVRTLEFSGTFSVNDKKYFYIKIDGKDFRLLNETCKRLDKFGKWETMILFFNKMEHPYSSNAICLHKDDFNPENIKTK